MITSGQSNLTKSRITATYGWFNGIQQVALVCMHRHLIHNSLGPSEPKIQTASQLVQPFMKAHRGVSIYNGPPPALQIATSRVEIWTPSNTWFPGSMPTYIPNDMSIGSAVFAQHMADSPYTLQWSPIFTLEIAPSHWGPGSPSNAWLLWPTRAQTASRWVQSFCRAHDCDRPADRQTDRPRYSVCNNRPQLHTAMRPKNW